MTSANNTSWEKELRKNIYTNFGLGIRVNGENSGRTKLLYIYNEVLGSEVGGFKKVNTGVSQITVPNSTRVSSWGSYDNSTIKKDINVVHSSNFRC